MNSKYSNLNTQKGGKKLPPFCGKIIAIILVAILSIFAFVACNNFDENKGDLCVKDFDGKTLYFDATPSRVVVLQASLASIWKLAGGNIVGISDDYQSYGLELDGAEVVGTTKLPSLEKIVSLNPDLVIYSSKTSGQKETAETLADMHIKTFSAEINTFEDYLLCLEQFTILTGRDDLYKLNGLDVKDNINSIISSVPTGDKKSVLFVRCKSSGLDIIGRNNIVCDMLENLNTINVAKQETNAITKIDNTNLNTSMEFIVEADPEYIFFVYMGAKDVAETTKYVETTLKEDAWKNLTAVKNKNYYVLSSNLFHYKPNEKWAQSYGILYEILYGEEK